MKARVFVARGGNRCITPMYAGETESDAGIADGIPAGLFAVMTGIEDTGDCIDVKDGQEMPGNNLHYPHLLTGETGIDCGNHDHENGCPGLNPSREVKITKYLGNQSPQRGIAYCVTGGVLFFGGMFCVLFWCYYAARKDGGWGFLWRFLLGLMLFTFGYLAIGHGINIINPL